MTQQLQVSADVDVDVLGDGYVNFKLIALQLHYFACLSMSMSESERV